jgi:hypothetical protein
MGLRAIGLVLITVGFIVGALASVMHTDSIVLEWFIPGAAAGVLGVACVQIGGLRKARDRSRVEANFEALDASLGRIVQRIGELDDGKADIDVYDLPAKIDELLVEDITTFADARESIAHVWGSQAYANVMTPFAAGERYVNRVWSTAADGYIDEAHAYLSRSRAQFADALERLELLHAQQGRSAGRSGASAASG